MGKIFVTRLFQSSVKILIFTTCWDLYSKFAAYFFKIIFNKQKPYFNCIKQIYLNYTEVFHSNTYKRDYCNLIIVKATHSSYHYYIFTMERQRSIVLKKDIVMYQKKTWQFNYFFMANVPKKLMILIIDAFQQYWGNEIQLASTFYI